MDQVESSGNVPPNPQVDNLIESTAKLQSIIYDLRHKLQECKIQVSELNFLQSNFRTRVSRLIQKLAENMEKESTQKLPPLPCLVTLMADSESQTEQLPRRWNSDLSLDFELKTNMNRFHNEDSNLCISTETMTVPVIRPSGVQRKPSTKAKFTNRMDIASTYYPNQKRPGDNFLLSDLGFTSQAPEFSQSEFNLSSEEHWQAKENTKTGGRVRFLSHDDGQSCLKPLDPEGLEIGEYCQKCEKLSQSGSWATLTHSERDFSELDSTFSLNYQTEVTGQESTKPITSTPYKGHGVRSKLKQSISFNDLLPSKATQSLSNFPKSLDSSSWIAGDLISSGIRPNAIGLSTGHSSCLDSLHFQSKRHSMATVELRPTTTNAAATVNRRSSISGDLENGPYVPSTISSLYLGGRVKALHGGHLVVTGIVWYRGRLPGINDDFVGIEIDQIGLGGDGTYQGHRYFRCASGRGLFVPFRKIIMAWPPRLP